MPDWKQYVRAQLPPLALPPEREAEIVEELAQHLEATYEEAGMGGASEEEARSAAFAQCPDWRVLECELRRSEKTLMGPKRAPESLPVKTGAPRRKMMWADFWTDLRYALRMMTRKPGFTTVAVLTLALGIGANTAIFSLINGILLQPLPFPESDRLAQLERTWPDFRTPSINIPKFVHWRDHNQVFEAVTAYEGFAAGFNLTGGERPERLMGFKVTADFFNVLGVEPTFGRGFLEEEDRPAGPRVIILSHGLWTRRFGGEHAIVGERVKLNGESYTVVGVMPKGFTYPDFLNTAELWTPLQLDPSTRDTSNLYLATARLKHGVTLEEAQVEMRVVGRQYLVSQGEVDSEETVSVRPLQEFLYGDLRPAFLVLLGAVGFVLLIACANVANLMLAQSMALQQENAIRTALGAGSSRIIRQFLTESVVLSVAGAAAGVLLCFGSMKPLLSLVPVDLPALSRVSVNWTVLGFTLVISVLTGLLAGILPSLHVARADINTALKEGSRRAAGAKSGRVTRLALVAGEIALTLIVLVGAALLIQTFAQLRSLDPGFDPRNILTLKMPLSDTKYEHSADLEAIHRLLLPSIEALPGVDIAGAATTLPMEMGVDLNFVIEGRYIEGTDEGIGNGQYRSVTPRFFQAMGIPLLRGRLFEASDGTDAPDVVIINAAAAQRYWPDEEPIGQEIRIGPPQFEDIKARKTVVGVVGDVKELGLEEEPPAVLYVPLSQMAERFSKLSIQLLPLNLVVKSDIESAGLVPAVEKAVWSYDPDQPVTGAVSMEQVVAKSIGPQKFSMTMMSLFAAVALLLALVGIYGVLSNIVAQRTHEIGIRIALGASKPRVLTLVMKEMVWVVVAGIGIGLAGSFALGRLLSSLLFGVSPTDPITFIGVTLSLVAVAFTAAHIPARKAASVEPIQTLRYE